MISENLFIDDLLSYGITPVEITELVNRVVLKPKDSKNYLINSIYGLYEFALKLSSIKRYDLADYYFLKCYEEDPNYRGVMFNLFYEKIHEKKPEEALEYVDAMLNSSNKFFVTDGKFYLHILSSVIDLPDKYKKIASSITYEDVIVSDNDTRYRDVSLQNRIRLALWRNNLPLVFSLYNQNSANVNYSFYEKNSIFLFSMLAGAYETTFNKALSCVSLENYDEAYEILTNLYKKEKLSKKSIYTMRVLKSILDIKNGNEIPEPNDIDCKSAFEAIDNYNFETALVLSKEYCDKYKITPSAEWRLFDTTLNDICKLIHESKNSNNYEVNSVESESDFEATYVNIVSSLIKQDVDTAIRTLKSYMNLNNKEEYEALIVDLIKLSLLQGDFTFVKPISVLSLVIQNKYTFDLEDTIQKFYSSITKKQFDQSEIYLDILERMNIDNKDLINGLHKTLDIVANVDSNRSIVTIKNIPSEVKSDSKTNNKNEEKANSKVVEKKDRKTSQHSDTAIKAKPKIDSESKDFEVEGRYKRLARVSHEKLVKDGGILLADVMQSQHLDAFAKELEAYKDIKYFKIQFDDIDRLVLRYCPYNDELFSQGKNNITSIIKKARDAVRDKKYADALKYDLQLLQTPHPSIYMYSNVGLIYLKLKQRDMALNYLIVATCLSSENNDTIDFSNLINKIMGKDLFANFKTHPKMKADEFEYTDVDDTYGIKDITSIINLATETGTSIAEVCNNLGMTKNQTSRVILFCAKKFYAQKSFDEGDKFMKAFEISDYKGKNNIKLYDEIKKNKRFYSNRADEQGPRLVLTLKPGKLTKKV